MLPHADKCCQAKTQIMYLSMSQAAIAAGLERGTVSAVLGTATLLLLQGYLTRWALATARNTGQTIEICRRVHYRISRRQFGFGHR
jgi:hypothetical protein